MGFWGRYVPVAERRAKATKKMADLKKKGMTIQPIEIQGRKIAKKFWGKLWCDHLETFSDYSNRLPRGRTYVSNGSVCHLDIQKNNVEAFVSGSELYKVQISISPLEKKKWEAIKEKCVGLIGSLLELLKGELSDKVMEQVANPKEGLFPKSSEIKLSCSCPDGARMCKHVAAVLYGVGSRLDEKPDLLFLLRDVDPVELIDTKISIAMDDFEGAIEEDELADIFGIDLEEDEKPLKAQIFDPENINAKDLQSLRKKLNLSIKDFSSLLAVTTATVYRWEKSKSIINMQARSKMALIAVTKKMRV